VVLALFIPLIISSGGNSGSQATSLIVRALALGELRAKDWWKVLGRELTAGLILGLILGVLGWLRVWLLPDAANNGIAITKIALTVSISLVGIVLWGNVAGAMLPFALRRFNFDPATASAPFVSTLVDVTGLLIYFTTASLIVGI
jgi:magnesium transporter